MAVQFFHFCGNPVLCKIKRCVSFGDNWFSQTAYKIVALAMLFVGGLAAYTVVWDLGDVGVGLMTLFNIFILFPMSKKPLML